jgi:hypothetical protein
MRSQNDISAKFSALSTGEKLILIGSVVFALSALILPWIKVSAKAVAGFAGSSATKTAVGEPGAIWGWLALLVAIILAGIVIARIMDMQLPALPPQYSWGQVFAAGGGALVVLTLLKAWRIQALDVSGGLGVDVLDKSFGFGFFIGILAALAVGAGGYMMYTEEKGGSFGGGLRR